jgi:hypothetical protein
VTEERERERERDLVRYLRVLNRGRGEDTTWVKVTSILSNPFFQFAMGGSLFCWLGSSTKD